MVMSTTHDGNLFEMNTHAPQTLMACAEAQILMNVTNNFAAPKAAEPLVVPLQDIITSTYLLTLKCVFLGAAQMVQLMDFTDDCALQGKYELPLPVVPERLPCD